MKENFTLLAKTFYGLETALAEELRDLGAQKVEIKNRLVHFRGDKGFMYKANLCLSTALKILKPIHTAHVNDYDALYKMIYDYPWEDYLRSSGSFIIDSVVKSAIFTHSQYCSQKVKDAIVDRFRARTGHRPNVVRHRPDVRIHIHIQGERCTVSLDSSGASLHQRGYRIATNIAPLNEVLAAGILRLSGWKGETDFMDPMCGSGTLVIEAALRAARIPANINRKHFAFENWNDWEPELFEIIRNAQLKRIVNPPIQLFGADRAPSAVAKAIANVESANLSEFITIQKENFFQLEKPSIAPLHLVTNPPYGERLTGDIQALYQSIGDTLKLSFPNTHAWIFSGNLDAIKYIGLRPSRKIKLYNGKLESRLLYYPVYEGSKKAKKNI